MRAGIRSIPATYRVDVLVHAPAERLRPQLGRWAEITEVDAQTCELRMTVDDLAWPAMALGVAGADFEVREPPELVELLRDWSARFARAAQDLSA